MNKKLMTRKSFEKYELSKNAEKELWKDALVIFDTSSLIDFYYYPKETRQEIFEKIFPKLIGRLWIPYHVQFEYLKNRSSVIEKPIAENYNPIKNEKLKELIAAKSKIIMLSDQIKKDTLKPEKHPYLPQDKIDSFISFTKELDKQVIQFEKNLKEEIQKQEEEIKSLNENDTILNALENYLEVGNELTFTEIMSIVTEGKLRYEFQIPPGYMDRNDKEGTQIFGDLIIWKEILSYSKQQQKNVIFVCNDLKIDWCIKDSRSRIEKPRIELIKEFYDNNGKRFWMYNQSQFTYKAKEYLEIEISDAKIEEISNVIKNRNTDTLIYSCNSCSKRTEITLYDLDLTFDYVGRMEYDAGFSYQYVASLYYPCSQCNSYAKITFIIYEAADRKPYHNEISIEGGGLIKSPDLFEYLGNSYNEPDEDLFRAR